MGGTIQPSDIAAKCEKSKQYQLLIAPMMDWMQGTQNQLLARAWYTIGAAFFAQKRAEQNPLFFAGPGD